MNIKYFEIGQDAMKFFKERERRRERIENLLYLVFCVIIGGIFMYQTLHSFSGDTVTPTYAEAQYIHSLEGGDR